MMELVTWPSNTWSIFDELESAQRSMGRAFAERGCGRSRGRGYPIMDIRSTTDGIVVEAELPGVKAEDVEISVLNDELTLRGEVKAQEPAEGDTYYRRERHSGKFTRTLQLPYRADAGAVKADYTNGILRITVPRSESEKPRKILIESNH